MIKSERTRAVVRIGIPCLVFLSGGIGIIFETLWTRLLSSIVGSTSVSMTCTFSAFILCLSLGSQWASRRGYYERNALRAYAVLEATIALSSLSRDSLTLDLESAQARMR